MPLGRKRGFYCCGNNVRFFFASNSVYLTFAMNQNNKFFFFIKILFCSFLIYRVAIDINAIQNVKMKCKKQTKLIIPRHNLYVPAIAECRGLTISSSVLSSLEYSIE